jgi:hypothetical protein
LPQRALRRTSDIAHALTELFEHRDTTHVLPMLAEDFTLKVPASLPYGGTFVGPEPFTKLFAGTPGGGEMWESFEVNVERILQADDHLVVQMVNRAVPKGGSEERVLENLWLFITDGDRIASAQIYADTAAARG